jgi:Ca2+-binding RTX toxin-like protein
MKRYGDTGNNVIYAQSGDWLYGGAGDDELHSRPSVSGIANRLYGGANNDRLFGYSGDLMEGGSGDDLFTIDYYAGHAPTIISGGSGYDSLTFVQPGSQLDFTQVSGIERITGPVGVVSRLLGTAGNDILDFTGMMLVNLRIDAGNGDDRVLSAGPLLSNGVEYNGGGGNDRMLGGGVMSGGIGNDIIKGSDLADILSGADGDDAIYGGAGDDIIDGGTGVNYIEGGAGNDTITGSGQLGTYYGGSGNDQIGGGAYVYGGSGDDYLSGKNVFGGLGNDRLFGTFMDGGEGNDTLNVYGTNPDNPFKYSGIHGGEGYDILSFSADYYLGKMTIAASLISGIEEIQTYQEVENPDDLIILGTSGNDTINFGNVKGTAAIQGGDGDDTIVGSATVSVSGGNGNDILSGARRLSGDAGDDHIMGGSGADSLNGGSDNDMLIGGGGNDSLYGADGNDIMSDIAGNNYFEGSFGKDDMTGGTGIDQFVFIRMVESGVGNNADIIRSFTSGQDKIDFSFIDPDPVTAGNQPFTYLGVGAFTADGEAELRYFVDGANSRIQADIDGNGVADLELSMIGIQQFVAADFVL